MKDDIINGKRVRVYDNGQEIFDRYTAVYMGDASRYPLFDAVGMSAHPFDPQGFGQHSGATPGRHLGRRIAFAELPPDCQRLVRQDCAD